VRQLLLPDDLEVSLSCLVRRDDIIFAASKAEAASVAWVPRLHGEECARVRK
jgi:hypothetical protein